MKVIETDVRVGKRLDELQCGDVFRWDGSIFIKSAYEDYMMAERAHLCVNLYNGHTELIPISDIVEVVEAEVTVKPYEESTDESDQ